MTHVRPHTADTYILAQGNLPVLADIAVRFAVVVTKWATNRRTRLALKQLEPWQLLDVGVTPDQAASEASRVFWKV